MRGKWRTSANGNLTFPGLHWGKAVVVFACTSGDQVLIPYYQTPYTGLLGAHCIRDTTSYSAITNTELEVDVWYFELP